MLLLVTWLVVSELAAWARRPEFTAVTGGGYPATVHGTASLAQASCSPATVAE